VSEYIKFSCERVAPGIASFGGLADLNAYRRKLLRLRLIGMDPNGIGFGNLSVRDGATDKHRLAFENGFHERISSRHDS
jgi:hypothetical protein